VFAYSAYGLHIHSALALPELIIERNSHPDVIIEPGSLEYQIPTELGSITCLQAAPEQVCLSWGKTAILLIRNGREITIDPFPGVDERVLRLFILGPGLGVLLHQRRLLVLHASAVAVHGQVTVFIGEKGWGKSTTAAALCRLGHPLMTDDLVAIYFDKSGNPMVLPGYPQVKLWPDSVEALGGSPEDLPQLRDEVTKRAQSNHANFPHASLPLAAVYVLGSGDQLDIESLPTPVALMQLIRHLYVSRFGTPFVQSTQDQTYFLQCAELVKRVPVRLLRRRNDLTALDEIAMLVESDMMRIAASPTLS
jgi:hypothetical protein